MVSFLDNNGFNGRCGPKFQLLNEVHQIFNENEKNLLECTLLIQSNLSWIKVNFNEIFFIIKAFHYLLLNTIIICHVLWFISVLIWSDLSSNKYCINKNFIGFDCILNLKFNSNHIKNIGTFIKSYLKHYFVLLNIWYKIKSSE